MAADTVRVGRRVALEAGNGVDGGRRRPLVDEEAGRAEGLGVEAQDAGGAQAAEYPPVADVVEQPPLLDTAVTAHGGSRRCQGRVCDILPHHHH